MSTAGSPAAEARPVQRIRAFGWRDKVGYLSGDVANNLTFYLQTAFFLIFYTNVMGIQAAHVGTLLFGARILGAFTDFAAGRLIDVARPGRSGRFKPWLLRFMVPAAASSVLMFTPLLQDGSYGARLAWMTITYVLWGSVCYTLINIPYGSMVSVISPRPGDRAALSVLRSFGGYLAYLGQAAILPLVVYVQTADGSVLSGSRMMCAAIGCGLLAILCYLICLANVEERVVTAPTPKGEGMSFGRLLGALVANRALTGMIAGSVVMLTGTMMLAVMLPYLFTEYFGNGQLLSLVNIVGVVPILLFIPFATALAGRFGKRELGVAGIAVATAAGLTLFLLGTDSPYLFMVGYAVFMLGVAGFESLVWAVVTDVIDFHEVRTGERNDGTVYGMYSWARKLGQALAGGLSGWALGWIGYASTSGGGAGQSAAVLDGIYALSTLVPALLMGLAGLILALWYPLSRRRVQENVALLAERRTEESRTEESRADAR